jgi:uncharacterized protein YgiB involved in biofilm formation
MTVSAPSPRHASTIAAQTSSGIDSSENDAVASAEITTPRGTSTPSCSSWYRPDALPPTRAPAHADSSGSTAAARVVVIGLLLSRTITQRRGGAEIMRRRRLKDALHVALRRAALRAAGGCEIRICKPVSRRWLAYTDPATSVQPAEGRLSAERRTAAFSAMLCSSVFLCVRSVFFASPTSPTRAASSAPDRTSPR